MKQRLLRALATGGALACFSLMMAGCSGHLPGRPAPGPEIPRPDAVLDFTTLYKTNCSACHGPDGMGGPSYPLANPEYLALVDDTTLRNWIADGRHGTLMPAFARSAGGMLTDAQIDALVKGIRRWAKPEAAAGAAAPAYAAAAPGDAAHGAAVYTAACARCHGTEAQPGKAGSITDPTFLALISDQGLRTITIAGRPDLGQPDWRSVQPGHPLSDGEVTDVVAWLGSLRQGGATAPAQNAVAKPGQPGEQKPEVRRRAERRSGGGVQ